MRSEKERVKEREERGSENASPLPPKKKREREHVCRKDKRKRQVKTIR